MPTYLSTQLDVTRPLQFVGEGLLTTSSNFASKTNPTYTNVGLNPVWSLEYKPEAVEIRKVGSMTRDQKVKVFETGILNIKTHINTANGLDFAKWCFNAPSSTGTIAESFDFAWSYKVNTTEYFARAQGCLPMSATLDIADKGMVELSAKIFVAKPILPNASTFIGTGSWATASSGAPFTHSDGGSSPFTFNATTYGTKNFSMTASYELATDESSGDTNTLWARPTVKTITGSVEVYTKDLNLLTDAKNQTSRTMSRVLKSATNTISFTDVVFNDDSIDIPDADSSDPILSKLSYTAGTVAIS